MELTPELQEKKVFLIEGLKRTYKKQYDAIQPLPYVKDKLYCVDKVFVEGGIEVCLAPELTRGTGGSWERLESYKNVYTDFRFQSKRRIIQGEPGYGKSTLTLQLAYDWCNDESESSMNDVEVLILLRLRQLGRVKHLFGAIKLFLLSHEPRVSIHEIEKIINSCSSVHIILDGYDEYPGRDSNCNDDVHRIIKMELFADFDVSLMTRYLPTISGEETKRAKLTGFDDKARDEYIRKAVVGNNDEAVEKIKQRLYENSILADLCQVPLLFVMFAHMAQDQRDFLKFNSVTHFFIFMIRCFHGHLKQKLKGYRGNMFFPHDVKYHELYKIAFEGLNKRNQQLSWIKTEFCERVGPKSYHQYILIGILVEEDVVSDDSTGDNVFTTMVRFYHKRFCEWYAAHHLVTVVKKARNLKDKLRFLDPVDLQYLFRFACGLDPHAGKKLINHLKRLPGGDTFAILCILEQTGDVNDIMDSVKDLCSRDVKIKRGDSALLQRSTTQLLQIASKNDIPISCLHLEYSSIKFEGNTIVLHSGISLPILLTVEKVQIAGSNQETLTEKDILNLIRYGIKCRRIKELMFDGCLLPLIFPSESIPAEFKSRDMKVFWKDYGYSLNLQSGVWEASILTFRDLKEELSSKLTQTHCEDLGRYFSLPPDQVQNIITSTLYSENFLLALEERGYIHPSNVNRLTAALTELKINHTHLLTETYMKLRDQETEYDRFLAGLSAHLTISITVKLCDNFEVTDKNKKTITSSQNPGLSFLQTIDEMGIINPSDVSKLKTQLEEYHLVQAVAKIHEYQSLVLSDKMMSQDEGKENLFIKSLQQKMKSWFETMTPVPWKKSCQWKSNDLFIASGLALTNSGTKVSSREVDRKCKLHYLDIFTDERLKSETRIILQGQPGSGKTMLSSQLAYDWCCGKLLDIPMVIYLPLKIVDNMTISQAIKMFYIRKGNPITEEDIESLLNSGKKKVYLILDGLEEYNGVTKDGSPSEVMRVMTKEKLSNCIVMITARTDYTKDLPTGPMLTIGSFGEDERNEYIKKVFSDDQKRQEEVKELIDIVPFILDICIVPLLFVLLVHNIDRLGKLHLGQLDRVTPFVKAIVNILCSVQDEQDTSGHLSYQQQQSICEEDESRSEREAFNKQEEYGVTGGKSSLEWEPEAQSSGHHKHDSTLKKGAPINVDADSFAYHAREDVSSYFEKDEESTSDTKDVFGSPLEYTSEKYESISESETSIDPQDTCITLEELAFNGLCKGNQQLFWQKDFVDRCVRNSKAWIDAGLLVVEEGTQFTSPSRDLQTDSGSESHQTDSISDESQSTSNVTSEIKRGLSLDPDLLGSLGDLQTDLGSESPQSDFISDESLNTSNVTSEKKKGVSFEPDLLESINQSNNKPILESKEKKSEPLQKGKAAKYVSLQVKFLHKLIQEWFAAKYLARLFWGHKLTEHHYKYQLFREHLANIDPADLHYVLRFTCHICPPSFHVIASYLMRDIKTGDCDIPDYIMNCICLCFAEYDGYKGHKVQDIVKEVCRRESVNFSSEDSRLLLRSKVSMLTFASRSQIPIKCLKLSEVVEKVTEKALILKADVSLGVLKTLRAIEVNRWDLKLIKQDYEHLIKFIINNKMVEVACLLFPCPPVAVKDETDLNKLQSRNISVKWIIGAHLIHTLNVTTGEWMMEFRLPGRRLAKSSSLKPISDILPTNPLQMELCINTDGGVLELPDTGVSLDIPPGALEKEQLIQMRIIPYSDSDSDLSFSSNSSVLVELLPSNLKLLKPVNLTLPHCLVLKKGCEWKAKIYSSHHEEGNQPVWRPQPDTPYVLTERNCVIKLNHFSWEKFDIGDEIVDGKKIVLYAAKDLSSSESITEIHVGYYWDLPGGDKTVNLNAVSVLVKQYAVFLKEGNVPLTCRFVNIEPPDWTYGAKGKKTKEISFRRVATCKGGFCKFVLNIKEGTQERHNCECYFEAGQGSEIVELLFILKNSDDNDGDGGDDDEQDEHTFHVTTSHCNQPTERRPSPDMLGYTRLKDTLTELLSKNDCHQLARHVALPTDQLDAIINSKSYTKDLLDVLEERGVIHPYNVSRLLKSISVLKINEAALFMLERYQRSTDKVLSKSLSAILMINKEGGRLDIPGTGASLEIPSGALEGEQLIQMIIITPHLEDESLTFASNSSLVVELLPSNVNLLKPAILTLPHCLVLKKGCEWKAKIYRSNHKEGSEPQWEEQFSTCYELGEHNCVIKIQRFSWEKFVVLDKIVEAKNIIVYASGRCGPSDSMYLDIGYYWDLATCEEVSKLNNAKLLHKKPTIFYNDGRGLKISLKKFKPKNWKCSNKETKTQMISFDEVAINKGTFCTFELDKTDGRDECTCRFKAGQAPNLKDYTFLLKGDARAGRATAGIPASDRIVTNATIQGLSELFYRGWMTVGRKLEIGEPKLEAIDTCDIIAQEKVHRMLLTWRQSKGKEATCGLLGEALQAAGRKDLKEYVYKQV